MIKKIIFTGLLSIAAIFSPRTVYSAEPLTDSPVQYSADVIVYDKNTDILTATGTVTLYQDDKILRADRVTFNNKTGEVFAKGNITLQDKKGNILYMEETRLEGSLRDGFIKNARILFSNDARLAASEGIRVEGRTTLKNALYSPCKVCQEEGPQKPVWQIRASEITHDEKSQKVSYKNVVLQIAGFPVFYAPYFSHPDPTVRAASGFLIPTISTSSELGVNVKAPYHFVIAQHKDFTFEPIITSREGIVFGGTYRQHTGNGQYWINGSATNANKRAADFTKTGDHEIRGHLFSEGKFNLDKVDYLNEKLGGDWQWDYALKWVSDDTYLRRYYNDKSDVLENHAKIERFSGRNYITTGLYAFQGLDEEDISGQAAHALPSFDVNLVSKPGKWGNQYSFNASGVALYRSSGAKTRRLSVEGAWKIPFMTSLGDSYTLTASIRGDVYHNSDSTLQNFPQYGGTDGTHSRILPKISLDWSMPFIKVGASSQHIIEPIISIIVAPTNKNFPEIANEDSRNFDFDENNLFSHNRYNGHDRWEGGSRLNYGLRYSMYSNKMDIIAMLGQSVRLNDTEKFPIGSGFEGKSSDFVGRLDLRLGDFIDYVHRFRLDNNTLALRRNELLLSGGPSWMKATVRYLDLDRDATELVSTELENRRELAMGVNFKTSEKWSFQGSIIQDLLKKDTISYDVGLLYQDECLQLGLRYEQRFTTDRDIAPSNTFYLRMILKSLG